MKQIQNSKYLELLSVLGIGGAHPGGINLTKEIFKHEPINDSCHVLDVGCGTGQTAAYLTQTFGAKVTALDINPTMLEKAKYRMKSNELHVEFIEGSIENTSLLDSHFDFIITESVLSFVNKPKALSEIYRLLKDGGRFIAIEQTMNERLAPADELEIMQFYGFDSLLMESDWEALLIQAGFENIQIQNHTTIESEPDFHYSNEIDPELYNVMKKHIEIMLNYQGIISYRIYACTK
ncbi:methyltransferase domain-containing protein [Solibacillus sp. MA9]|uniref:Methyltransferase domain-containing protein n=1 Tax=Solibacillus palustris TaxID=2908203 RepID=A0ABS9UHC0_9BACL|nr:methyltransferase domain-containing protein [Solibacillus sp. MA9]